MTGYTPEEHYDDPDLMYKIVHPEDHHLIDTTNRKKVSSDLMVQRWVRKDGRVIWTEQRITAHVDSAGGMIAFEGIARDITKRKQMEDALVRSQRLLAETERMGKVGGWEFDIDTRKQDWTPEVFAIHEVDLSFEPTVENGIDFYTPASKPIIQEAVQRIIEQGEPFDLELEIISAKGHLRSVHAIGKADQKHRRIYGFFQDITARKRMEQALNESNERFTQFMRHLPGVAFIKDSATRHLYVNHTFENLFQLNSSDWQGKTNAEVYPPAAVEALNRQDWSVFATNEPLQSEDLVQDKYWLSCKFPISAAGGVIGRHCHRHHRPEADGTGGRTDRQSGIPGECSRQSS